MNTIDQLVKSNMNKSAAAKTEDKVRFMLVLDQQTRDDLRDLCEDLNVAQIGFASDIFTAALNDAMATYKTALEDAKAAAEKPKA